MFALIINESVFLFDMLQHYGVHLIIDVNLKGYQIIEYKDVIKHYEENYFDSDLINIEQYSIFLYKICLNYIRDYSLF